MYRFVPVGANASTGEVVKAVNANFAQLDNEAVSKVFKGPNGVNALITGRLPNNAGYGTLLTDPDNIPRAIIAMDPDGNPVIKISEDGVDVTTATDDQLTFNSAQNVFKIVDQVTIDVDVNNSPGTYGEYQTTYAHGLGYSPAYAAYVELGSGRSLVPAVEYSAIGVAPSQTLEPDTVKDVIVDTNNIVARVQTIANNVQTYTFHVYILQETAE